jgi:protein SCO1/2
MIRLIQIMTLLSLAAVLLAACSSGKPRWNTSEVTGAMPDLQFTLTDDNGNTVHANTYSGKIKLLYFGYTHCPDVCPQTLAMIRGALDHLGDQADAVRVLFVSVDPSRDTPTVLKSYTQAFGPRFVGLTGNQAQLKALTSRYHASYSYQKPDANGAYAVNHIAQIYVFDRHGRIKLLMDRTDSSKAMTHDLKQLISDGG